MFKKKYKFGQTLCKRLMGVKKDQREYHACGVGKKFACLKKGKKNCSFIACRSLKGCDRAGEAKVVGGAMFDGIK